MDKSEQVDRETLYREVWTDPVTVVAERYGLSDVGLAKLCKRLQIPLPRRGYWAKLKAGKKTAKAPLPTLDPKIAPRVTLSKPSDSEIQAKRVAKENACASRRKAGDIEVPSELDSPHPLVRAAARSLKRRDGWSNVKGLRSSPEEVLDIEVTRASLDRALLLADTLIKVLVKQDVATTVDAGSKATFFDVQGTRVRFAITEYVSRSAHQVTPSEQRARERYWKRSLLGDRTTDYPTIPQYDYHPTGLLTITLGQWPSRNFRDTDRSRLEDRLGQVVAGLVSLAAEIKFKEEEKARREEQYRQAEERRQLLEARFKREEADFKNLEAEAASWERATSLRRYIEAVEQRALANYGLTAELVEWIAWARAKADWLDPLIDVCDPILDAPLPKRASFW